MAALMVVPPGVFGPVQERRRPPQVSLARPASPARPASLAAVPGGPRLAAYRGLGAWIDIYDRRKWARPGRTVARLSGRGVRTIFLQTANYGSRGPIRFPKKTALFLRAAHARGLRVVGWYVPDFVHLRRDLRRSVAAIRFRAPTGDRFDSFGLDIEANILPPGPRTRRLLRLSKALRKAAGPRYPLGAITPSPRGMELSPRFWPGFPYARLARHFDVFVPMAYWTYRTRRGRGAHHYIARSVQLIRNKTGRPRIPIHMIGGLAGVARPAEVRGFVKAVRRARVVGASLYDADTTGRRQWNILKPVRQTEKR